MNATKMTDKQTAVEWLIDNWIKFNDIDIELDDFANLRPLLKQAKEMEMEQRFKDFKQGFHSAFESLEAANNSVQSKTFKSE